MGYIERIEAITKEDMYVLATETGQTYADTKAHLDNTEVDLPPTLRDAVTRLRHRKIDHVALVKEVLTLRGKDLDNAMAVVDLRLAVKRIDRAACRNEITQLELRHKVDELELVAKKNALVLEALLAELRAAVAKSGKG